MIGVLSPLPLLWFCWTMTGLGAAVTLARLDRFDLVASFMQREHLDLAAFGALGLAWIALGLAVYTVADLSTARTLIRRPRPAPLNLDRAASFVFRANLILLGVTGLWIVSSAAKLGGLSNLVALAVLDSLGTRDILLENKLFVGMRLFYAALPATGGFAAVLLFTQGLSRRGRLICLSTVLINTVALFLLPIVMSQRLLLLQFLLSAYIGACMAKGRVFGAQYLGLGALVFFGLWVAREAVTNPLIDRSPFDIGGQKLAFYLVNDLWNAFAPLGRPIEHTFGMMTLEGLSFLTFTDGYFLRLMGPRLEALDDVLGGGEFPFLTAAYVDFGPFGGAAFIAAVAVAFRMIFFQALASPLWAAIYAQIGGAMLFSSHSIYFTHQNFLFSVALIVIISRLAGTVAPRTYQVLSSPPVAEPAPQGRARFRSRRAGRRPIFTSSRIGPAGREAPDAS